MSLFIGSLAFEEGGPGALSYRLGILAGSPYRPPPACSFSR